ncbi:MAG: hypothetical protein ACXAB4_03735 [Candidatus Hodarchaeales archaeon]|jgi:hypothetical protein
MARVCAKDAALYIGVTRYAYSTDISLSLTRDVAEVNIHQQNYNEKCVGPYSGEFSGSGVVDDATTTLFDQVTAGDSATISIYPSSTTDDYWTFTGYFTSWDVSGPSDNFWTIDFGGIVDGAITRVGFS